MINYLKGTIIDAESTTITLMVQGVGFEVIMPKDGLILYNIGEEVGVYTYMHVRENEICMYGFSELLDKKVFNLLINVSGIGPKSASQMLGAADAKTILNAIHHENEKMMSSFPGVGKKTAARIILELKDKVEKQFLAYLSTSSEAVVKDEKAEESSTTSIKKDLIDTLLALGYSSKEIDAIFNNTDIGKETDISIALKLALQYIARS